MEKDERIFRDELIEKKCLEVAKAIDGLKLPEVLVKRALKMMKFPMNVWYEYKSKRHNRWLVLAMIMGRK